jgi:class 3 adenylate cyclase
LSDFASKRTVLVVDDDPLVGRALIRLLDGRGYAVHFAGGGAQGLELLAQHPIQVVISDKDMPGMNGLHFLQRVRELYPRVCRILLTGRPDLSSTIQAINEGEVYRFLEKPWSKESLLSTLFFAFETVELEASNRKLVEDLAQARRAADELLRNVLPRAIADRLLAGETLIADRHADATVLFSDIVDFTRLSSRLQPGEVIGLLNELFSAFDALADAHGVEKIKTIGDGYLAVALPLDGRDGCAAIAELALAMQAEVQRVAVARGLELQLRIGLHTGPLVAGVIGKKRFSYDLWGDTVNTASRMESTGVAGRLQVTTETRDRLAADFEFEHRGIIDVKGKGPTETWFVVRRR